MVLNQRRVLLHQYWYQLIGEDAALQDLIDSYHTKDDDYKMQFLLDCSVLPDVILVTQNYGSGVMLKVFKMTRTYCYSLHRERLKRLDRWS